MCHVIASKDAQFLRCHVLPFLDDDKGVGSLAPLLIGHTHHRDLLNGRVTQENALNLDRGDVLSATDDHVLEAVANFDIAIGMDNRRIAAMKPPSLKGTCGSFLIVVIALHHDIAACYNFADSLSVVRNLIALC